VFPNHKYDTNYGLSESIGPGCVHLGVENVHKVGAIGKAGYKWETKIVDENGIEHECRGHWIVLEDMGYGQYIVYEPTTKIIYFLYYESDITTPYQMRNEDGFICGAVYENGQITPVPYFPID
jgi:hypothetical protein